MSITTQCEQVVSSILCEKKRSRMKKITCIYVYKYISIDIDIDMDIYTYIVQP